MAELVRPREPEPKRRPTIWEQPQALQVGDFCDLCVTSSIAQRKQRTYTGWQACPRCDRVANGGRVPPDGRRMVGT